MSHIFLFDDELSSPTLTKKFLFKDIQSLNDFLSSSESVLKFKSLFDSKKALAAENSHK